VLLLFAVKIGRARAAAARFHAPVVTRRAMTIQEKIEPSKRYRRVSGRIMLARLFRARVRRFHLRCRVSHRPARLEARCLGNENPVHAACLRPRAAQRLSRAASTCRNAAWTALSDDDGRGGFGFVSSVTSGPSKRVRNLTS